MTKATKKIYGYFGHHKCASTWFGDIFYDICYDLGLRYKIAYREQDFNGDLRRYIAENNIDFITYANADFRQVAPLENLVGIHAVRDPRDIIVSAYFSHLKTHPTQLWPELIAHRKKLQQCDLETGLFHEIAFRKEQFDEMRSWKDFHGDNIMEVRMEDVTSRTYQSMLSIVGFLGLLCQENYSFAKRLEFMLARALRIIEYRSGAPLPRILHTLPAERVLGIVWKNEFEKRAGGRKVGEENQNSHYRKGVPQDWKNYLTRDHIGLIEQSYNDVILQYGYEESPRTGNETHDGHALTRELAQTPSTVSSLETVV
jgi:hypothetical protein